MISLNLSTVHTLLFPTVLGCLWDFLYVILYHLQMVAIYFFLIWIPFISLSCLIALAKTSSTILKKNDESGYPHLDNDLREKSCTFHHWVECQLWVCCMWPLLFWDVLFLCIISWGFLSWKGVVFWQILYWHLLRRLGLLGGSMVKNLPAVQETWVQSLCWKIPWKGNGNPLKYSCLENSMDRGFWCTTVHEIPEGRTQLSY